jgi:hypothetical protein
LTSIPHASALPSSATRAGPSPPYRAAPLRAGPAEQRSYAPATPSSTVQPVRATLLPYCAMTGPLTGTADTEAVALEVAAAAPPSDVPS